MTTHDVKTVQESKNESFPEIGEGNRWYDIAYCITSWALDDKRRFLSKPVRNLAGRMSVTLYSFYQLVHIRNGDWPYGDLRYIVASGAIHVHVPGIWMMELFPPSKNSELLASLRNAYWDNNNFRRMFNESPIDRVVKARESNAHQWWTLGTVVQKDSSRWMPDSVKASLPKPFSSVSINILQVGSSITAICAFFEVEDGWTLYVDKEWHTAHPPAMYTPKGCPRQLSSRSREHALAVHKAEFRMQSDARKWMSSHFQGVFTSWDEPQPIIEMMIFEGAAATSVLSHTGLEDDALKEQLGIDALVEMVSPDLPGLFIRELSHSISEIHFNSAIVVVGAAEDVRDGLGDRLDGYLAYNQELHRAIARCVRSEMRDLMLDYVIVRYTDNMLKQYGKYRDMADRKYETYRSKQVDSFRQFILNNSIDIREAKSDIDTYFEMSWRFSCLVETRYVRGVSVGNDKKPTDIMQNNIKKVTNNLNRAIELDNIYCDVLSTVVSLGADERSLFLARVALWVSVISLVLAVFSMSTTGDTLYAEFLKWLSSFVQ